MGCHFLLQGIFLTQGLNLCWRRDSLPLCHQGSPIFVCQYLIKMFKKTIFSSTWRKLSFKLGVTLSSVKRFLMVIHNVNTSRYYIFSNNFDWNSWSGESVGWRESFKGPWLADSCFHCILIKETCIFTFAVIFWLCESGFWPGLLTRLEDWSVEGSTKGILKKGMWGCGRMPGFQSQRIFFRMYVY